MGLAQLPFADITSRNCGPVAQRQLELAHSQQSANRFERRRREDQSSLWVVAGCIGLTTIRGTAARRRMREGGLSGRACHRADSTIRFKFSPSSFMCLLSTAVRRLNRRSVNLPKR